MMKTTTVPMICGIALAAMSAAGVSHWWSVQQFVAAVNGGLPVSPPAATPSESPVDSPAAAPSEPTLLARASKPPSPSGAADASQRNFYEALVAKMEAIQNQNRDLLDQVAETNRDVMKLEFRVDTHSESFRPMPVSDDHFDDMSFDDGPGVLPPRAEPVFLPSGE